MNDNLNKDELMEQFISGKLSGTSLDEFYNKLATDSQFKKEVALHQAIVQNIKTAGREKWKSKLENIHREMDIGSIESKQPDSISRPIDGFYNKQPFKDDCIQNAIRFKFDGNLATIVLLHKNVLYWKKRPKHRTDFYCVLQALRQFGTTHPNNGLICTRREKGGFYDLRKG